MCGRVQNQFVESQDMGELADLRAGISPWKLGKFVIGPKLNKQKVEVVLFV